MEKKIEDVRMRAVENGFIVKWDEREKRTSSGDYNEWIYLGGKEAVFQFSQQEEAFDFFYCQKQKKLGFQ